MFTELAASPLIVLVKAVSDKANLLSLQLPQDLDKYLGIQQVRDKSVNVTILFHLLSIIINNCVPHHRPPKIS